VSRWISGVLIAALGCQAPDRDGRSFRDFADNAIYRVVLDSLGVLPSKAGGGRPITLYWSTIRHPRAHTPARFTAVLRRLPGVDSTMILSFETRNDTAHSLADLRRLKFRAPLVLVTTDSLPVAPIADMIVDGKLVAVPHPVPDPFWTAFQMKYPDSDGYVMVSSIGYNTARDLAIVTIWRRNPDNTGEPTAVLLRRTGKDWRIVETDVMRPE
jgi:hypothetical protein